ncbi:MAG: hypothetical protein ACLQVN_06885 [Bryobacteraceae bacterium]
MHHVVQSGFVFRFDIKALGAAAAIAMGATGCSRLPTVYPPPAQAAGLPDPSIVGLGPMVAMADPRADAYIVGGFRPASEGTWRWAHDHPVLRFYLPDSGPLEFVMDLSLPEQTFARTGPVEIGIAVNGREMDQILCEHAGSYSYHHPVAEKLLRRNAINIVTITPDKTARRQGGEKLGFVLSRAGFAE